MRSMAVQMVSSSHFSKENDSRNKKFAALSYSSSREIESIASILYSFSWPMLLLSSRPLSNTIEVSIATYIETITT